LQLIAKNLSTGYLWEKIRVEGGAYGGRASVSAAHPVFTCGSYRDPNISKTLDNFQGALKHIASGLDDDEIDQSIIGTIGSIDHPKAPHTKGLSETLALISGRSVEYRQRKRESVLDATSKHAASAAKKLIDSKEYAVSVLGSEAAFKQAESEGLAFKRQSLFFQ
jgi:hypothetical protein